MMKLTHHKNDHAIVDKIAKPKSSTLLWPTDYSFVLPCDIDACIHQLNALKDKYRHTFTYLEGKAFNFESLSDNGGVVYFEATATPKNQAFQLKSVGQLIYQSPNQTAVKLHIDITLKSLIQRLILSIVILMILVTIYMGLSGFVMMLGITIIMLFTTWASFLYLKAELYTFIYEALQELRVPRKKTLVSNQLTP